MDIFSYNCAFYVKLIKHSLVSYPLKVSYALKVSLRNNSRGIVVVVAVWVVVAGIVKVVFVKVGLVAVVSNSNSRSIVEVVVGAVMYL